MRNIARTAAKLGDLAAAGVERSLRAPSPVEGSADGRPNVDDRGFQIVRDELRGAPIGIEGMCAEVSCCSWEPSGRIVHRSEAFDASIRVKTIRAPSGDQAGRTLSKPLVVS